MSVTIQSRESEMNRAAAALSWSSLLATPHSLLTSHDRRDEHCWTKTTLNKTFQFAKKPHAVNTLQREGEHLGVGGSMLDIVRPVLELVLVSWALQKLLQTLMHFRLRLCFLVVVPFNLNCKLQLSAIKGI